MNICGEWALPACTGKLPALAPYERDTEDRLRSLKFSTVGKTSQKCCESCHLVVTLKKRNSLSGLKQPQLSGKPFLWSNDDILMAFRALQDGLGSFWIYTVASQHRRLSILLLQYACVTVLVSCHLLMLHYCVCVCYVTVRCTHGCSRTFLGCT